MTWVSADEEEGSGLRGHCCDESDDRASTGPSAAALRLLVPALTLTAPGALLLLS